MSKAEDIKKAVEAYKNRYAPLESLSFSDRLTRIRDTYEIINPMIFECAPQPIDPYFLKWESVFTPIERDMWGCIRSVGVPMYPQYPVLNYFIDFADPIKKIGLEADGKQWHDKEKDRVRDQKLFDQGWRIFRATGKECSRVFKDPYELDEYQWESEDQKTEGFRRWYMDTVEGIVCAINFYYYDGGYSGWENGFSHRFVTQTLGMHRGCEFPLKDNYGKKIH